MSQTVTTKSPATVKPQTDIVASAVADLRAEMMSLVKQGCSILLIDLSNVEMIDSAGLGSLITAHKMIEKSGGKMEIHNASPELCTLFKAMRLDRHFAVNPQPEEDTQ